MTREEKIERYVDAVVQDMDYKTMYECVYEYIYESLGFESDEYTTNTLKKMTDKEMLRNLFEFETYCTSRFDSEARVALAVYEYVKQMKQNTRHEMSSK